MSKKLIIILFVIFIFIILFLGLIYSLAHPPRTEPIDNFFVNHPFSTNAKIIREQVNFTIPTRSYYNVYGLADGDVDTAVRIFNHPDYPDLIVNGDMSTLENVIGDGTICYYYNDNHEIDCVNGIDEYVKEILKDLGQWIF